MTLDAKMQPHVEQILERIREPMGLDRWNLQIKAGTIAPDDEARAACHASPEYREAVILFDFEKALTGDDVEETVVHESTHCLVWPLHAVAEDFAKALTAVLPSPLSAAFESILKEDVRKAAEQTTTDLGHAFLRLFRRLWKAEAEIKVLKAEITKLKKNRPLEGP